MNVFATLIRAVEANPGEDTPRLALADWLDENGRDEPAARCRWWVAARRAIAPALRWPAGAGPGLTADLEEVTTYTQSKFSRAKEVIFGTSPTWHLPLVGIEAVAVFHATHPTLMSRFLERRRHEERENVRQWTDRPFIRELHSLGLLSDEDYLSRRALAGQRAERDLRNENKLVPQPDAAMNCVIHMIGTSDGGSDDYERGTNFIETITLAAAAFVAIEDYARLSPPPP